MLRSNENAPHKCVILVKAVVYEVLPSGECSGIPVEQQDKILQIDGQDKFIAIRKMNEFLEEIKQCSMQK